MEVYVVCFQGIPTISFSYRGDLVKYLEAQGTSIEKVTEDMECNGTPNWEWYQIACDGPDYKFAYNELMKFFSDDQQKELGIILKGAGF